MSLPTESPEPLVNTCPACEQLVDVSEQEPFDKIQCPHCGGAMRVRARFDHFQLVEQIGQGGMSRVFRATDSLLNRDVALKLLSHDCGSDSERIIQFEREARITASFSHPNVVKVFSVGKDQGYFYIAMELVSYSSFEDVITRRGRVSEGEVLNIGIAVTQGLLAAHGAGLIHRDIKPGNILFAEDGTAKIVDFGLALMLERDVDTSTEIWATPYYVAPEKLSGEPEDFRSDLYSLGATLYHALAGVPPVEASTTSIEELKKLKAQPVDIASAAPGVAGPTAVVINRMLAHNPADRFDSYEQLAEDLQSAKLGKAPRSRGARSGGGSVRRKKMLISGGLAVAFGLVAIFYFWLNDGKPDASSGGGDFVLDGTTAGAGSSAEQFLSARRSMLAGDFPKAAKLFQAVSDGPTTQQPTTNWALFNLGLAHLFQFNESSAVKAFESIVGNGVYSDRAEDLELVSFFLDVGKQVPSRDPFRPEQRRMFEKAGYQSVGLLAIGLRRWGVGDVTGGAGLLKDFQKAALASGEGWVVSYGKLVDPFLADAILLGALPIEPEEGSSEEEAGLLAMLKAYEETLSQLSLEDGPHRVALALRLAEIQTRVSELKTAGAEVEANLAVRDLRNDRKVLQRELKKLNSLRDRMRFDACAQKLSEVVTVSDQGGVERDVWVGMFRDTAAYLKELGTLKLGDDFVGPVVPKQGAPVQGVAFALVPSGIKIRRDRLQDTTIPFQGCSPAFLIALGNAALSGVDDSDRYIGLVAGMASFARVYDLHGTIPSQLQLLASLEETIGSDRVRILRGDVY